MVKFLVMKYLFHLQRVLSLILLVIIGGLALSGSVIPIVNQTNQVRSISRPYEFDYVTWTLNAFYTKFFESALGTGNYLSSETRHQLVLEYLMLVDQIQAIEYQLISIYSNPTIKNTSTSTVELTQEYEHLSALKDLLSPVVEDILEDQISYVLDLLSIDYAGQPLPPVLYHSTPLPLALIVSPRDIIRQDQNISLIADMTIEEQVKMEECLDQSLNVSSLVVHIGGVGVYPTMVQQTSSLNWLSEVIAHEWVHNYLTLRPLGMNYMTSDILRVMNETTASIAGKEISEIFLETFFPELIQKDESSSPVTLKVKAAEPATFDFREEMHKTRIQVDLLLAEGKIEEAEEYMEERRLLFWEQGYQGLRKLNQAYFAFHGAYADQPGGAAPQEDPVGEAVRTLRDQSDSLAEFLNRISWMYTFDQLLEAISETE